MGDGTEHLTGRSVVVVGATGGIGSEVTGLLAERGARLTLVARGADRLAELDAAGIRVAVDITKSGGAQTVVDAAMEAYGAVDGIVYAAGAVAFGAFDETPDAILIDLFNVNALAPMRMVRTAAPALRHSAAEGRSPFIVVLSGLVAETPMPGMSAYSAAKAAIRAWDTAATRELRRDGIRLIDARPPHTETGLADRPLSGTAPKLPEGLSPRAVAVRIVAAIEGGEKDLGSDTFG